MLDRSLLRLLDSRARFGLALALAFIAGLLVILQAWLLSRILTFVFLGGWRLEQAAGPLLLFVLSAFLRACAGAGSELAAKSTAVRIKREVRIAFFDHLLALGPSYIAGRRTGDLTTTAVEAVEALDPYFSQYLPQLVIAALVPLAILLFVLPLDLLSGLVLLLTAPLVPVFMVLIGKTAAGMTRRQYLLLGRLGAHLLDTLQGLTTLKLLNRSRTQAASVRAAGERYARATLDVLRVAFLSALVLELVATISTAIVAVEVGLRLLYGQMELQPALFILVLAPEFYLPLRILGQRFHAGSAGAAAGSRILEVLDSPLPCPPLAPAELWVPRGWIVTSPQPVVKERGEGERPGKAEAAGLRHIEFRDVCFSHADGRGKLEGVSFDLYVGDIVALFGPSGAGKSTLLSLLLRFASPDRGEILVDGIPLAAIPPESWRERIAWVPQSPHLLNATLAANIRLGCAEASFDCVVDAARAAHLDEFIQSLPEAYETQIGEGGLRLSAGQAQRLALARAFIKNSPVLLLDEPASNVDPELEDRLRISTERIMAGRTVLVIAHRLSTIHRADRIVVLAEGRVRQVGTHSTLLARDGIYRRLILGKEAR